MKISLGDRVVPLSRLKSWLRLGVSNVRPGVVTHVDCNTPEDGLGELVTVLWSGGTSLEVPVLWRARDLRIATRRPAQVKCTELRAESARILRGLAEALELRRYARSVTTAESTRELFLLNEAREILDELVGGGV